MTAHRLASAAVASLTIALLVAAPAGAHVARPQSSFSTLGQEVVPPYGVGIHQRTGDLYVAGLFSAKVGAFGEAGAAESSFGSPRLTVPITVAVDNSGGPSDGDVYVVTAEEGIPKLEPSGKEAAGFIVISAASIPSGDPGAEEFGPRGVAVNPVNGDVVVEDGSNGEVDIFSESGAFVSQFKGGGPPPVFGAGLAVGAGGEIFTSGAAGVQEWSPADGYSTPTTIDPNASSAVAVDSATGHIFVDEEGQIAEYDAQGHLLLQFGAGELETSGGVVVHEATNTVYASTLSGAIEVFGPPRVLADVTTATPASAIASTSATLSGSVNPAETTVTGCSFEYGLSTAYGATSPCSSPPPLSGNTTFAEEAGLARLQPHATYHYRLVAVNSGGQSAGEDETFATPPADPSLDNQSVSALTQTSAILNASINPNNQATSYHFEYGTSAAYGTVAPAPDANAGSGYGDTVVGQPLAGLEPGTTYHFRVVAENATGVATGVDESFTTPPPTAPIVTTGAASAVSAEAATISGSVNPRGVQSAYEFDLGVDTGYGTRIFGEAGGGTEPRSFSVSLTELTPSTTYHYRLIATSSFGISYGPDEVFTTSAIPTAALSGPSGAPLVPTPPFPEATTTGTQHSASTHVAGRRHSRKRVKRRSRRAAAHRAVAHRYDRRTK